MTVHPHSAQTARADATATVTATATSFCGIRERVSPLLLIVASGTLSASGTSSAEPARVWENIHQDETTTSGLSSQRFVEATEGADTTRQAVSALRRISGLTWEQLGELFAVSRRSVHFWASGKPLNASNEQRLMQVLDVVRAADRGDVRSNRAALFEVREGTTAFALLTAKQFKKARAILGSGATRPRPALVKLSAESEAARKPLPPKDLVGAQHDRVHRDRGRARAARTVRNKRRGTP